MPVLNRMILIASFVVSAVMGRVGAQCPGTLSDPPLVLSGVNGTRITAMVEWDPDGAGPLGPVLVVSGDFTQAGAVAAAGMAVWDGHAWTAFPDPIANAPALVVFNGQLVAGLPVVFTGFPIPGAVKVWDGAAWQPMGSVRGPVNALAVFNGQLYGGLSANSIQNPLTRWNGTAWQSVSGTGAPLGRTVYALQVFQNKLYLGGTGFSSAPVMAWDGTAYTSFPSGPPWYSETIRCLGVHDNTLYAGGDTPGWNGAPEARILRYDGVSWSADGLGFWVWYYSTGTSVYTLQEVGGELYAGGDFGISYQGHESSHVSRLRQGWWGPMDLTRDGGFSSPVHALAAFDGALIIGSGGVTWGISTFDGTTVSGLAEALDGAPLTATALGNDVFVGGGFVTANGVRVNGGVLRGAGGGWTPMGAGPGIVCYTSTVRNGELYVGGTVQGVLGRPVRRWDGAAWSVLGSDRGQYDSVFAMTEFNGDLVMGGSFHDESTNWLSSVIRWDGAAWHPITGLTFQSSVAALQVLGTQLVAGGGFAGNVAAWDVGAWHVLGALDGGVSALALFGGELVAGGYFQHSASDAAAYVARWDGTAWRPMREGCPAPVSVLVNYDHRLVAIGRYSSLPYAYFARAWDGWAWTDLSIPAAWRITNAAAISDRLLLLEQTGYWFADFVESCGPVCGRSDYDGDGDSGTDADIEAFFACLAGNCCSTCGSADFDGDGDVATDADIEAFFRVLAGGTC